MEETHFRTVWIFLNFHVDIMQDRDRDEGLTTWRIIEMVKTVNKPQKGMRKIEIRIKALQKENVK